MQYDRCENSKELKRREQGSRLTALVLKNPELARLRRLSGRICMYVCSILFAFQ